MAQGGKAHSGKDFMDNTDDEGASGLYGETSKEDKSEEERGWQQRLRGWYVLISAVSLPSPLVSFLSVPHPRF